MDRKYWFLFRDGAILLRKRYGRYEVPESSEPPFEIEGTVHVIAMKEDISYMAVTLRSVIEESEDYVMIGLRESYDFLPLELYRIAGKASEILFWDRNTRFCPACGTPTELHTPISKLCPSCGKELFPQVSPAILVMVKKEDKILLVHARNFKRPFKSLVAGFVETGESLEECVQREVKEETSLEVSHVRYFGSQEWPYPSGLMIGFVADYISGEIQFLDDELSSGDFYSKENLPMLPQKLSLARKMIDAWMEGKI